MRPSFRTPAAMEMRPARMARAAVRATNSALPCTAISPMVAADMMAMADETATTSWRERAQRCVGQQGGRGRVERELRGHARQLRVGHALRDEDGADGQAGDDVEAQPAPLVAREPREHGPRTGRRCGGCAMGHVGLNHRASRTGPARPADGCVRVQSASLPGRSSTVSRFGSTIRAGSTSYVQGSPEFLQPFFMRRPSKTLSGSLTWPPSMPSTMFQAGGVAGLREQVDGHGAAAARPA